ncbi:penicillin-binding protein 2 [Anaerosolibacter carboniphilus]|uniref:Penicillin-binding protein 2 n=1 Tax=Anaerosolibacter carboniphilus TaxID=1417629 RepID=A0A841KRX5_9FIRM|nr:penicillin-binding transpeptidase domain-containing protein [Anaerosolibacter carboniphilus]MBB6214898.1 penicillin-binding protein 2 [Anaerosolibacter carboniphilus]
MFEKLKSRYNQILLFFGIFITILFIRLFTLTIVEGEKYKELSDNIRIKKIPISAPRGELRDRYGRLLAGNRPSFTVQIMKNELINSDINEIAIKLLNILNTNGDKHVDNFPIAIENGKYYFSYDKEIENWLLSQGLEGLSTAEDVFKTLRERLEIDQSMDEYEAQTVMQQDYGIYPPISVKTMKFIPQMQKENFLQKYKLEENLNAEEAFQALRDKFKIPEAISNEDARKILIIRHELQEQGYRQYQPVTIAFDVSAKTVSEVEERIMEMPGVSVEVEPIRYYPGGNLASHIIGYLSKISDSERERYVKELGYDPNDLIGKDGIERVFEKDLKGKDGAKYVEVDVYGRLINVLREEEPQKGETMYLTIDAKLQKVAEDALAQALEQIQVGGTFKSKWGDYKYGEVFRNATTGTVVALDAKTMEVLALANYPSFNPNLFATGISSKDWNELQDKNPRDPLSPIPLYNLATRAAIQPGSTFKMITGLAAIESGLNPNTKLFDNGFIPYGGRNFGCWLWNTKKQKHGYVDLYKALEVSCNYYFYNVSTGWDHFKQQSLGISMNVNKLLEYTKLLGLDERTGIEISENAYGVPNPQKKTATIKSMLKNHIKDRAKDYFEPEIYEDKETLEKNIAEIVSWADENPSRGELINRTGKLGVKKDKIETLVDTAKFTYFNQAKWSKGDTFNLSIGQGEHAYTPLQMARYIAAIANDGYLNKVSVVKKVGTETPNVEKEKGPRIELNDYKNLSYIRQGMSNVTQEEGGTARAVFGRFPIKVGGKTGTAERSGKIQPRDEAEYLRKYWKWIAPSLSLTDVEAKAKALMTANKDKYRDEGDAMREAIRLLSNNKISNEQMDQFKEPFDNFAWFVSYAPLDDPQIVVVSLIFQGGHGGYAGPIVREIIAEYLGLNKEANDLSLEKALTR